MTMETSQIRIIYYPKYDNRFSWVSTGVDLTAYLDFNSEETIEKKIDGSNLPFLYKEFGNYNGTYVLSTRTYTVTGVNWETDRFKWHTLIDNNNNRFVILSNTSNTITIAESSDFIIVKTPVSGTISITLPDFENDDIIEVYGWKIRDNVYAEPANFTDKIIFIGQVAARKIKHDSRGTQINIKLMNMTELLLKTTRKWAITDINFLTSPEKIGYVITQVNGMNKGLINIEFDAADYPTTTTGDAFKTFTYFKDDSPAYDVIFDLSRTEYTGDVYEYYAYIKPIADKRYELIWEPKLQTINNTYTEGIDFDLIEFNNDKAEIISSLIVVCGRDANNYAIRQMVYGDFKRGSRTKRMSNDITAQIFLNESNTNPGSFDFNIDKYPTSFPYTTATSVTQNEVDALIGTNYASFLSTTGTYSISSKANFNKFIRYLSKARAIIYGKDYLNRNNYTRDKLVVRFYTTPAAHIPGRTAKFNIPTIGWTGGGVNQFDYRKNLRLNSKRVGIDSSGIFIECEYLEDDRQNILPI